MELIRFRDQKTVRFDQLSELSEDDRRNYELCRRVEDAKKFFTAITVPNSLANRSIIDRVIAGIDKKSAPEVFVKESQNDPGEGTDLVLVDGSPSSVMRQIFLAIGEEARKQGGLNPATPAIRTPNAVRFDRSRLVFTDERFLPVFKQRFGQGTPYVSFALGRGWTNAETVGLSGATFEEIAKRKLDDIPAAVCLLVYGNQELGRPTVWRAHELTFNRFRAEVSDEVVKTYDTNDLVEYVRRNLRRNHPINLKWIQGNLDKQVAFMQKGDQVTDEALADAF